MGTRADFYVGRGETAEWLGSIAMDGYPDGIDDAVKGSSTEAQYRAAVAAFIAADDRGTTPEMGWPWPWEDSRTTDYAYAFVANDAPGSGAVWASSFGHRWFLVQREEPDDEPGEKVAVFPNMKSRQNVTMGPRSGLIVLGMK